MSTGLLLEKRRANQVFDKTPDNELVSIIVPARNEEQNLSVLFLSLKNQTEKNFELILIDDRSEDHSLELMYHFQKDADFKVKIVENKEAPGFSNPKVNVLIKGVEAASGDLYFFTDADCKLSSDWVSSLRKMFNNPQTGVVCGFLRLASENNVLCRLQNFDHFYRMMYAFCGIGLGIPVGCFGNNLAIRKQTYVETGGYELLKDSATEDAEMIARVKQLGTYKIRAIFKKDSIVDTVHKKSWKEHSNQARRWASGAIFSKDGLTRFGFFVLMLIPLCCLACIIPACFNKVFFIFPILMYAYLYFSSIIFGLCSGVFKLFRKGLFLSVLIYPFIYVDSFFKALIFRKINWKGTEILFRKGK
ncbi:MAG: glycosyltransferase [Spirochaetales bacterium]|nr:glycosyltransferase [Spirochaetales bacterium]